MSNPIRRSSPPKGCKTREFVDYERQVKRQRQEYSAHKKRMRALRDDDRFGDSSLRLDEKFPLPRAYETMQFRNRSLPKNFPQHNRKDYSHLSALAIVFILIAFALIFIPKFIAFLEPYANFIAISAISLLVISFIVLITHSERAFAGEMKHFNQAGQFCYSEEHGWGGRIEGDLSSGKNLSTLVNFRLLYLSDSPLEDGVHSIDDEDGYTHLLTKSNGDLSCEFGGEQMSEVVEVFDKINNKHVILARF